MAKFGSTILLAGALTLAANSAFADQRDGQQQQRPRRDRTAQQVQIPQDGPVTALTKDGKSIQVTIEVPTLNKGNYTDDQFKRSLRGGIMMGAMQVFSQYTEAEIAAKMPEIQKKITDGIGMMIPMGGMKDGKPEMAQPGVNYGTATVTKVSEINGGKVVFEQKAPATKPATQPAAKKPGA
ncbi:MAG: hypothetical protein EPN97_07415 [Alphaproteobacteria bacterium]|nr:MAG: hypothetical protein EPN97_07415 [Alphaproteobacteria bacterium]